jgi:hypothetical protein
MTRLKLAVVLTHDKGDVANQAQVTAINNLVELHDEQIVLDGEPQFLKDAEGELILDEDGNPIPLMDRWLAFKGVVRPHEVLLFQIVPAGVREPSDLITLPDGTQATSTRWFAGVFYSATDKHDQDQGWFNWGLKRATDYGAEFVLFVDGVRAFDPRSLALDSLGDFEDKTWGRVASVSLQRQLGKKRQPVMREDMDYADAKADLLERIEAVALHG